MPPDVEPTILEMKVSEIRNVAVSFIGRLDSGELLTGTPTVVEVTSTDLTISDVAVNTAQITVLGKTVATGQAVQFKVLGGAANTNYSIRITTVTDATPAQTFIIKIRIRVKAD